MITRSPTRRSLMFVLPMAGLLSVILFLIMAEVPVEASEPETLPAAVEMLGSAERGRDLLTRFPFNESDVAWGPDAFRNIVRVWERTDSVPLDVSMDDPNTIVGAFRRRYGLHEAPFDNDNLPMGLRAIKDREDQAQTIGISLDCMVCHGGSIGDIRHPGLGNTTLDLRALLNDMTESDGGSLPLLTFRLNSTRGLVNASQLAAILIGLRNADLSRRYFPLPLGADLPETDVPAWWLLKYKDTQYYDGRTDTRSVRANMQFFLGDYALEDFQRNEAAFRDVMAYIKSLEAPQYPFAVDRELAETGRTVFRRDCAQCHGTYGPARVDYPNEIIPLNRIGTDPVRAHGLSDALVAHYNKTWFAEHYQADEEMVGYQAPPLVGVWATAPYLHNGSVPTLWNLLDSSTRPDLFRKPADTGFDHYDTERVGWKVEVLEDVPADQSSLPRAEAYRLFDTSTRGLSNQGHYFGDHLDDDERRAVIEYLKTL